MTDEELARELEAGGRFVVFDYCVSVLVLTFSRTTKDVYFVRPGESAALKGMRWTLLTLVAGWWGFPWGLLGTPIAVVNNLLGGQDVTSHVVMMVLRWDEKRAVDQFIEQGPAVMVRAPRTDPADPVPESIKQIRL